MLIDTHCHLVDRYVPENEIPGILQRARDSGVGAMIIASADPDDPEKVIAMCNRHDNMYAAIGIHPHCAGAACSYEKLLNHPRVVAVGEIGLDYHYPSPQSGAETSPAARNKQQIELFRAQMDIAKKHGLPVAIHTREAESDTAEILCAPEYDGVAGVMHCYTSGLDLAKKMLDRGFYFSASGIITFKNSDEIRDVFRQLPTDRILVETDAPYCAPVPYRGKNCEPAMVRDTAKVLADVRGIPLAELENILMENTRRLFPKMT
ncbi:MAG: TatD family hydrolase [Alphaproteobacteria bacterium]|nr:TatD family hydrolase [Alphaproteobacteria bacterium]